MSEFRLDIRSDIKEVTKKLSRIQKKQIPYASALALTRTAEDVRTDLYRTMLKIFDAPVAYTVPKNIKEPKNKGSLYLIPADKKKKRLSITGKKQRTEPEELVMDNIGRCEIYQAGSTEPDYIVNVIDIVIEKDSSGGPNKSQIVVPSWKIETPTTEIETVDTVQYSRIERFAGKALKFLLNRE